MVARALLVAALVLGGLACGGNDDESAGCDVSATEGGAEVSKVPELTPLDSAKTHELIVETNRGSFTVTLDPEQSPCTTASIVDLARNGFFDGTKFHRIVPGFVIQGGDPTGTGTGGPGYTTVDAPPPDAAYTKGVVAMAKTAADPPGTSGSQFFVVTADDAQLPPDYAIVGEVTEGIDVVDRIGTLGDAQERPTETVVIRKVTVRS